MSETSEKSGPAVRSTDGLGQQDMWFSYDPGDGYETHDTEAEARERAEKALQYERDEAGDGWNEEVTQIAWGKVIQRVEEKWRKHKPPPDQIDEDGYDEEGNNWSQFDELVEYHLCPNGADQPQPPKT